MKSRNVFFIWMAVFLSAAILPAFLVYCVDPFHFFHKAILKNHGFDGKNMFFMAPGIIDNYLADPSEKIDSVVVGTSTSANYDGEILKEKLGWGRAVNISLPGGNPAHNQIILQKILEIPTVKNYFIELSYHYSWEDIYHSAQPYFHEDDPMDLYLYDDLALNNARYLFNANIFYESIMIISGSAERYSASIGAPASWKSAKETEGILRSKNTLDSLIDAKEKILSSPVVPLEMYYDERRYQKIFSYINRRLAAVLMPYCNADVDIIINFSPRPTGHWRSAASAELYARRYVVNIFSGCKNIRVYAEDQYEDIVSNPANFLDDSHYIPEVNELILEKIALDENRLTPDSIALYEKRVIENVNRQEAYLDQLVRNRTKQEASTRAP
jgi:hypothetical protein